MEFPDIIGVLLVFFREPPPKTKSQKFGLVAAIIVTLAVILAAAHALVTYGDGANRLVIQSKMFKTIGSCVHDLRNKHIQNFDPESMVDDYYCYSISVKSKITDSFYFSAKKLAVPTFPEVTKWTDLSYIRKKLDDYGESILSTAGKTILLVPEDKYCYPKAHEKHFHWFALIRIWFREKTPWFFYSLTGALWIPYLLYLVVALCTKPFFHGKFFVVSSPQRYLRLTHFSWQILTGSFALLGSSLNWYYGLETRESKHDAVVYASLISFTAALLNAFLIELFAVSPEKLLELMAKEAILACQELKSLDLKLNVGDIGISGNHENADAEFTEWYDRVKKCSNLQFIGINFANQVFDSFPRIELTEFKKFSVKGKAHDSFTKLKNTVDRMKEFQEFLSKM